MPTAPNIYEIPNPYAAADLFDIHFVQSADVLTLVHPSYAPLELRRLGATNWQTSNPLFSAPANVAHRSWPSATVARGPDALNRLLRGHDDRGEHARGERRLGHGGPSASTT
jgi:hypothetical protein